MEPIKLDYSLESPSDRVAYVEDLLKSLPQDQLKPSTLEYLGNYIIFAMDKEERKNKKILTDNRLVTINKRETSYEGIVTQLESGADGIYNMIESNSNVLLAPKNKITKQDIAKIPPLAELRKGIEQVQEQLKTATGRRRYLLRKNLIEMRKEQYTIKNEYQKPISLKKTRVPSFFSIPLPSDPTITNHQVSDPTATIDVFNPKHISLLLSNYSRLKADTADSFLDDMFYLLIDLENAAEAALRSQPVLREIMVQKIDGASGQDIQDYLLKNYDTKYTCEYISSLWRNKIPELIAEQFVKDYLEWYYSHIEKGVWKKCSRCGETKLAHPMFFTKNNSSKDGFYSICKCCRNKKGKE